MCLNHLFCTIGTSYEWINDELVSKNSDYLKRWQLKKSIKKAREPIAQGLLRMMMDKLPKDESEKYKWDTICEDSPINNIPKGIKPDWLKLVNECKKLLKEDGIEIDS